MGCFHLSFDFDTSSPRWSFKMGSLCFPVARTPGIHRDDPQETVAGEVVTAAVALGNTPSPSAFDRRSILVSVYLQGSHNLGFSPIVIILWRFLSGGRSRRVEIPNKVLAHFTLWDWNLAHLHWFY
jgi:hypothetical protein